MTLLHRNHTSFNIHAWAMSFQKKATQVRSLNYIGALKMAAGLSDGQIEEFREAFHLFDKNQDGTITTKDLGNVLKAIGQNPSDEETQQLMERVSGTNPDSKKVYFSWSFYRKFVHFVIEIIVNKCKQNCCQNKSKIHR